jgi:hypothetical protein
MALLDGDAEWTQAHAIEIARAQPDRWKDLLYAMYIKESGDQLDRMAATIVAEGITTRRLVAFATRRFGESTRERIGRAFA